MESLSDIQEIYFFKFNHALTETIKSNLKANECQYNSLFEAWLCPRKSSVLVKNFLDESQLKYEMQIRSLPTEFLPANKKIGSLRNQLDILTKKKYEKELRLSQEIIDYNANSRPEDFIEPPKEEHKSPFERQKERDFHERKRALEEEKKKIHQLSDELRMHEADTGSKIIDPSSPLLTAESLASSQFEWKGHRTICYCYGAFWIWNGINYVEKDINWIRMIIYNFSKEAKVEMEVKKTKVLGNFNPTKAKVDGIIDALKAVTYSDNSPEAGAIWLDGRNKPNPKNVISFQNGLLDVEAWLKDRETELISHTPLLLNSSSLPFTFDPSSAKPNRWLGFLASIWQDDQESIDTLQEWMGYLLTQDTRQHKILLIVGPKRSGKGTIGRIICDLLGEANVVAPTLSSLSGEFGLQPWLNKMLALIPDARLSSKSDYSVISERLLSISGEDSITINRKHKPAITVKLATRIMIMTNELPAIRDMSGALASRYILLTMTKSWEGKEDRFLYEHLRKELSGILLWALEGLIRLKERGYLCQPYSGIQQFEDLEAMGSPIKAFIKEKCELGSTKRVMIKDLFDIWMRWCADTGYEKPGGVQQFGKNLKSAFPQIKTAYSSGERIYEGVGISKL